MLVASGMAMMLDDPLAAMKMPLPCGSAEYVAPATTTAEPLGDSVWDGNVYPPPWLSGTVLMPRPGSCEGCNVVDPSSLIATTPEPEGRTVYVVPDTTTPSPPCVIVGPATTNPSCPTDVIGRTKSDTVAGAGVGNARVVVSPSATPMTPPADGSTENVVPEAAAAWPPAEIVVEPPTTMTSGGVWSLSEVWVGSAMIGGALFEDAAGFDRPEFAGRVFVVAPWAGITGALELVSCSSLLSLGDATTGGTPTEDAVVVGDPSFADCLLVVAPWPGLPGEFELGS
jgi:hypothetical protein